MSNDKYPCPLDGCEAEAATERAIEMHIEAEHGPRRLAMHRFFTSLGGEEERSHDHERTGTDRPSIGAGGDDGVATRINIEFDSPEGKPRDLDVTIDEPIPKASDMATGLLPPGGVITQLIATRVEDE